jgi:hypothetical protein
MKLTQKQKNKFSNNLMRIAKLLPQQQRQKRVHTLDLEYQM